MNKGIGSTVLNMLYGAVFSIALSGCFSAGCDALKSKPRTVLGSELVGQWEVWVENQGVPNFFFSSIRHKKPTPGCYKNLRYMTFAGSDRFYALATSHSFRPEQLCSLDNISGRWRLALSNRIFLDFGDGEPATECPITVNDDGSYGIEVGDGIFLRLFKTYRDPFADTQSRVTKPKEVASEVAMRSRQIIAPVVVPSYVFDSQEMYGVCPNGVGSRFGCGSLSLRSKFAYRGRLHR